MTRADRHERGHGRADRASDRLELGRITGWVGVDPTRLRERRPVCDRDDDRDQRLAIDPQRHVPNKRLRGEPVIEVEGREGQRRHGRESDPLEAIHPCGRPLVALGARPVVVGDDVINLACEEQLHRRTFTRAHRQAVDQAEHSAEVPDAVLGTLQELRLKMVAVRLGEDDRRRIERMEAPEQGFASCGRFACLDVVQRECRIDDRTARGSAQRVPRLLELCGYPHKSSYPERRVMPTPPSSPLRTATTDLLGSA